MNRPSLALALAAATALAGLAHAETLQDALAAAYRTNPVLQGQRYQQQALDETYVQAKVGWRPTASFQAVAVYEREPNSTGGVSTGSGSSSSGSGIGSSLSGGGGGSGSSSANAGQAAITVTQPLYTGGRTAWAVREAEASVEAGREDLRAVEAQVLLSVVQAYADVLRDQQGLEVRKADLATLDRQAAEASAKFELGQVTKTDVAQAQAQLESARAAQAGAEAQLEISRAEYQAAVGAPAGALAPPPPLPGLPASVDQAFDLAESANPTLRQSVLKEKSSRAAISAAKANYRPSVALQGTYGYVGPVSPLDTRDYGQDVTAEVTLTVPIFTGGMTASQVRQATAQNGADRTAIEAAHRQVVQATAQAWSQLLAGRAQVKADEAQTAAAETALQGSQAEYGFGLRTTLEVLQTDETLRAAQLALAQARHDAFLAEAAVLQAVGRLEIANLMPAEPTYDPKARFDRVKNAARPPWEPVIQALDGGG